MCTVQKDNKEIADPLLGVVNHSRVRVILQIYFLFQPYSLLALLRVGAHTANWIKKVIGLETEKLLDDIQKSEKFSKKKKENPPKNIF